MHYRPSKGLLIPLIWQCLVLLCHCHQSLNTEPPKRFTIQFQSPLNDPVAIEEDRERFLAYLQKQNIIHDIRIRYNYSDVINGMSIEVAQPELSATSNEKKMKTLQFLDYTLSTCPYITRYWPGKRYPRPKTIAEKSIFDMSEDEGEIENYFGNTTMAPLVVDGGLPNLADAHSMTTVDKLKEEGWTGKGVKIAIIDTGVDYTHPSLGGCFGPGCLVAYGKDLVGDAYGPSSEETKPDDDPLDECDGHGTHVAGIIAANDTFKGFEGVATGVTLGVYRVFGCNGDTDDDIIIAAADMAVKAGTDIINLSLGGGMSSWEEDPLAVALSNMASKNITVVVAQGNEGRDGIARTPSPAIGKNLISVGSVDNKQRYSQVIHDEQSEDDEGIYEYLSSQGQTFPANGDSFVLAIFEGDNESICQPLDASHNITGKVVLVKRGQCDTEDKANNVKFAGGVGLLIYNAKDVSSFAGEKLNYDLPLPVATLSYEVGTLLASAVKAYKQKTSSSAPFNIRFTTKMVEIKTAGKSSVFSTWGPDPELHFKPEISAVGGYVFSTYPVNMGAYATLSGTSMATPYLTGCIALYIQATQVRDSTTILTRLTNYAKPTLTTVNNKGEYIDSPIKQGSGLVQIYDSIYGYSFVSPNLITLNDTEHFENMTVLTITNLSEESKLFEFDFTASIGVNGYNFSESSVPALQPKLYVAVANVTFDQPSIQLEAGKSAQINVYFEQPVSDIKHLLYGGFLVISTDDDDDVTHVPFYGSLDNQKDLPIFDIKGGYPFIGNDHGKEITDPGNLVYNFTEGGLNIYTRLGSPTARIKYDVIDFSDNKVLGEIQLGSNYYISRNDHSPESSDYALDWRGGIYLVDDVDENELSASSGAQPNSFNSNSYGNNGLNIKKEEDDDEDMVAVPPGSYSIRASVLKIFGDPDVAEDWEYWHSPVFQIIG
ncbi:peptidase S8/S53 domain-containing protein [Thamnidium elegans]|nr:peptidase S8/S53 domain-containing protein [Thamnidium elegans]